MAKFYGEIGFGVHSEIRPGVHGETIVKHNYYGDILDTNRQLEPTDQVNDNVKISNKISIVADPYANENFSSIRYVKFMGAKWKISNVEVRPPRLILTTGGVYNGQQT